MAGKRNIYKDELERLLDHCQKSCDLMRPYQEPAMAMDRTTNTANEYVRMVATESALYWEGQVVALQSVMSHIRMNTDLKTKKISA